MSLLGRAIIDRLHKVVSTRWLLPVPPYESTEYWDSVYRRFHQTFHDGVFEWGDVHYDRDLKQFSYGILPRTPLITQGSSSNTDLSNHSSYLTGNLMEAMKLTDSTQNKNILLLGCGNSKLGEDILQHFLQSKTDKSADPKIYQCDISKNVVETMSRRYHDLISQGLMSIFQDDATNFSHIQSKTIDAVIDKGLIDALHCARQLSHIRQVMIHVHQILKPNSTFIVFSFSRPEFWLDSLLDSNPTTTSSNRMPPWQEIEIRLLHNIIMYRFIK